MPHRQHARVALRFQCSSASRKFLNHRICLYASPERVVSVLFSEPKIPQPPSATRPPAPRCAVSVLFSEPKIPQRASTTTETFHSSSFQCSSASRKFLNPLCEGQKRSLWRVSVLFSEPKIPQLYRAADGRFIVHVSVLFSEPKIPQPLTFTARLLLRRRFSALQRAENSSTPTLAPASIHIPDCDDHASSFLSLPGASP